MAGLARLSATALVLRKELSLLIVTAIHENLACNDTAKQCKLIRDALDIVREITKLLKNSPRRNAIFKSLKGVLAPDSPGIRLLCPTRWTARADALAGILDNYVKPQELWPGALEKIMDTETKAQIQGIAVQMKKFDFFFGVSGQLILKHLDNLSRTLQKRDISASEGQHFASLSLKVLKSL